MRFLFFILLFILFKGNAQNISSSFEIRAGKSLLPADYMALRYQQATNYPVDYSVKGFVKHSLVNGLHYSEWGIDLLLEFPFSFFRIGFGPSVQHENEPWIYNELSTSQKINYGIATEGMGEWMMSEVFGLQLFAQQKWLFNQLLGKTDFVFGLGLVYHLNP